MNHHPLRRLNKAARLASALLLAACTASPLARAETPVGGLDLIGVNLSGANFAPHVTPGKFGTHYFFPSEEHFAYYAEKNIRLIRFPFIWERVQHDLDQPLDAEYLGLLRQTLDLAARHGQKVVLDMHNYGRYQDQLIGTPAVPYEAYGKVWRALAEAFRGHPGLLGYDIMNEPHATQGLWPEAAQAAVDAIREVDRQAPIFVEGDRWASAFHWRHVNEDFRVTDPADNVVYEAHLYLDKDFSGRYFEPEVVDPMLAVERARPFVEWLEAHGLRGFLGEYGVPADSPSMLVAMDNLLAYLNEHCIPSAYWAGGPGWGDYALAIEPIEGKDRPQMELMQRHLRNRCTEFGPVSRP